MAMLPLTTCESLAKLIDHPLVKPELTDEQVIEGLELAKRYNIACASVRPCDIDLAVRTLQGSSVKAGAVCGFPHGSENTATKLYEARDLLRRGAREIDMVIAISKLLSREFQHVQMELLQMSELCHKEGALLKVILENAYLTDELKIIACRCCERAEVDFVKTSTGFAPSGYTLADIALMRKHLPEEIGVKAAGGIRTVDQVLEVYAGRLHAHRHHLHGRHPGRVEGTADPGSGHLNGRGTPLAPVLFWRSLRSNGADQIAPPHMHRVGPARRSNPARTRPPRSRGRRDLPRIPPGLPEQSRARARRPSRSSSSSIRIASCWPPAGATRTTASSTAASRSSLPCWIWPCATARTPSISRSKPPRWRRTA